MAIVTTTQSSTSSILVGEVEVGTFNGNTDQKGNVSLVFSIIDPTTFFSTTEGTTNIHSLVDDILAQAKANSATA